MPVSKSKPKKRTPQRPDPLPLGFGTLLGDSLAKELDTEAVIAELKAAGQDFRQERFNKAQELVYDAWELGDPRRRLMLAAGALELCPWCGDAYGLLATAAPPQSDIAIHLWRLSLAAAEFALKAELGEDVFERYAGEFWRAFGTRPYMRARAGLSNAMWDFGEREAAVALDLETLRLNPNDNQGVRYGAASRLLALGRDRELGDLLDAYPEETAFLLFTRAAWAFRSEGDSARSRELLNQAIAANAHIPVYLLGRKRMPEESPDYYGLGDENEAIVYALTGREAWRSIAGAMTWLSKSPRRRGPLH
jgi:tetratricopeptide (TPR) repeat protein